MLQSPDNSERGNAKVETCEACGRPFICGGDEACWCASYPPVNAAALDERKRCCCEVCLAKIFCDSKVSKP